jgi:serine/threonine protein phosphatase 1
MLRILGWQNAMTDITYVIADLHGSFDLLEFALSAIERHGAIARRRTVVFLGDYIDRGPQSRQIIERLMVGAPSGWNWVCLRGNHENMMLQALSDRQKINRWRDNGGDQTLASYGHAPKGLFDPLIVPIKHQSWIRSRPLFYVDANRVYVHAGAEPDRPLEDQTADILTWLRYPGRNFDIGWRDKHVVHGHDPFEDGPVLLGQRTNLDTLAWRTGRLVVGVFDDSELGGPIDRIEVLRDRARAHL